MTKQARRSLCQSHLGCTAQPVTMYVAQWGLLNGHQSPKISQLQTFVNFSRLVSELPKYNLNLLM